MWKFTPVIDKGWRIEYGTKNLVSRDIPYYNSSDKISNEKTSPIFYPSILRTYIDSQRTFNTEIDFHVS